ncbi:hypothetical protein Ahy_A07g032256 isoform C [Arachis hypogaea]|uniref:Uncharacterized protein n=1 Tax=Arachis hypogaea TaxID=3818 RepID=A0A445C6L7_ARAHY|nr:hypothetical protein Ahy_A07g032256 isoform C [Arachis hypogaea]
MFQRQGIKDKAERRSYTLFRRNKKGKSSIGRLLHFNFICVRTANEAVPNGKGGGSVKSDRNHGRELLAREEAVPEVRPRLRYTEEWEREQGLAASTYK